jgi:hypothetical protein
VDQQGNQILTDLWGYTPTYVQSPLKIILLTDSSLEYIELRILKTLRPAPRVYGCDTCMQPRLGFAD